MDFYMSSLLPKFSKVIPKHVFAELPEKYEVSKEQFEFYDKHGFLVIKELIDFASLYNYKKRFVQICNGVVDRGNIGVVKEPSLVGKHAKREEYVNKIRDIYNDDVFATYVEHPRLLHVLSQFIGDNITAINSMLINKPPGSERHPSHQDLFYFPIRPADKIIAAWTAIDHVNYENGCLFVIPGSHKLNRLLEHRQIPGMKKLYHGIMNEEVIAPLDKRVHLDMAPGDTVFFHPLLVHGSGANVSKNYRKAMTCHFADSSACHYIDVNGTVQEVIAREAEEELKKVGHPMSYADMWRYSGKQVKGIRSNL